MGQGYTSTVWVAKLLLRLVIVGGQVAQLVEQRTENPCVAGSIPALAILVSSDVTRGYENGGHHMMGAVRVFLPQIRLNLMKVDVVNHSTN